MIGWFFGAIAASSARNSGFGRPPGQVCHSTVAAPGMRPT
jgi:hypothetical protein